MNAKQQKYMEIIEKVSEYVKAEEQKRLCEGLDFNFFSLYDMEYCEEETHQKMLYFIMNRIGNRNVRRRFMQRLGDILGFPKSYRDVVWEVDKEHFVTDGRIDLFLYSKEKHICVIIELKIGAPDGERQLEKYRDYAESCHYQDYRIVYLTLDGREPSSQSLGSIDKDKFVYARSLTGHIVEWLDYCIEICNECAIESSLVTQYKLLLVKLGEENNMNENIQQIIGSDEERLKACLRIEHALPEIEADILYNFLSELQEEFRKKRMKIAYSCIVDAKEYYGYSSMNPYFLVEICEFQTPAYGMVKFCMGIEVENALEKYIIFYRADNMTIIPSNEFARKQKCLAEKVTDAIQECLNIRVRENNYKSIWWGYIGDMDGATYDFKHFSDSCIKLVNPELRQTEAERIARLCIAECRSLKNRLK